MVNTPFIRECIVDKDRAHQISDAIAAGASQYGMQTFDQSILSLHQQGLISYEEALCWASNVDEFKLKVQGISTTADIGRADLTGWASVGTPRASLPRACFPSWERQAQRSWSADTASPGPVRRRPPLAREP